MEKNWGDTPSATLNIDIFLYLEFKNTDLSHIYSKILRTTTCQRNPRNIYYNHFFLYILYLYMYMSLNLTITDY